MQQVHILLVEDNEGDIILTTEAFEDSQLVRKLSVARNGKEALDFLYKKEKYQSAETPDLILLDINLPLKNGFEVLQTIKTDESLKLIPVIMFTTSSSPTDVNSSYKNHANCFITKPLEVPHFMSTIEQIEEFWFNTARIAKIT